jgi:predicted branched-subunit amino acid permease
MTSDAATAPVGRAPDLRAAAQDAGVIWLGLFALGIGFGVVVTSHGFPWWLAPSSPD